jgi:hypothetical protein
MTLQVKVYRIAVLGALALTVALGPAAAQSAQQAQSQQAPAAVTAEFEGTVKVGLGQYFYLPSARGYDVVIQGRVEGQDASFLTGKEVRVKGEVLKDEPSVFVADSIELNEGGNFRNVFTRTEAVSLQDHIKASARQSFPELKITKIDKADEWEGKGKGKIYGKLVTEKSAEGKETYAIIIADDKGKDLGKILVDNTTDYGKYYIKKLRLFNQFWFYLTIKDSVDVKVRRRTRELFHADLLFAGLY